MPCIIDISMPIHPGMPVYKNKPEKRPHFETTSDFPADGAHETRIAMDAHTGTHVDAPLHMLPGGAASESIALERLVRPCRVLDLRAAGGALRSADLAPFAPQPGEFLLLKTANSLDEQFNPEFSFLAEDGARLLADCRIAGVGIDALGIERAQPGHPTHKILFAAGIVIVEGLRLARVEPGSYMLAVAPLALLGSDAAPARAFLWR